MCNDKKERQSHHNYLAFEVNKFYNNIQPSSSHKPSVIIALICKFG